MGFFLMSIVTPYIESLERLKDDIPLIAYDVAVKNAEKIIKILQDEQLGIGLNSFGSSLSFSQGNVSGDGTYTEWTEQIANHESTRKPKQAGDVYNFEWTGSTFDSMILKADDSGEYQILSTDGKMRMLEGLYGKIFDLTPQHNEYVNEVIIKPELYKYLLNNLFKI